MRHSTLPFPFANALDVNNQVLVLFILSSLTNSKHENVDLQKLASQLKLTHYDCLEMTENNFYHLNHVSNCNIAPENPKLSGGKITMCTKQFRQELNAIVCKIKYQSEQWQCDFGDDSSMDGHHAGGITIDLTVTASQCRTLANGG